MIVYIPTLVSVKFKEVRNKFIILETELDPSRNNSNVGEISENLQPHRKSVYALNFSSYTPLAVRPESDPQLLCRQDQSTGSERYHLPFTSPATLAAFSYLSFYKHSKECSSSWANVHGSHTHPPSLFSFILPFLPFLSFKGKGRIIIIDYSEVEKQTAMYALLSKKEERFRKRKGKVEPKFLYIHIQKTQAKGTLNIRQSQLIQLLSSKVQLLPTIQMTTLYTGLT